MTLTSKSYTKQNVMELAKAEEDEALIMAGEFSPAQSNVVELFGNPESFSKIVLQFKPFVYEATFLKDMHKRQCLIWGRQTGKTTSVAAKAIYHAMLPNQTILILAPTQRQSSILFNKIRKFITSSVMLLYSVERMTQTMVHFKNKSTIYALPASDGSGIRGFSANLIIIDEAAFLREEAISAITPMMAATNGTLILMGTPFGKYGILYKAYTDSTGYSVSHIQTSANPLVSKEFLDREKERLTETQFRQEYLAEFIEELDTWFSTRIIMASVEDVPQLNMPDLSQPYKHYLGVDVARFGSDETVFIISREYNGIIEIINMQNFIKKPTTHTEGLIKELNKLWNIAGIYVER